MTAVGAPMGPFPGPYSLEERRPAGPLAAFVSVLYVKRVGANEQPSADLSIPSGRVELRCRVGSMPVVVGPHSGPLSQVLQPGETEIGIRFHAGAAAAVVDMPAIELIDQTVGIEQVFGKAPATAVADRIAGSKSCADALTQLQRLVEDRLADASDPDPLVREVVRQLMPWRGGDVTTLSAALGISPRQLRRRCLTSTGLAPKVLHRMLRFQGFLALGHQSLTHRVVPRGYDLAGLAAEAGYTDQSHLTRECIRLAGQTPAALLDEFTRDCVGHDHAASYEPIIEHRNWGAAPSHRQR